MFLPIHVSEVNLGLLRIIKIFRLSRQVKSDELKQGLKSVLNDLKAQEIPIDFLDFISLHAADHGKPHEKLLGFFPVRYIHMLKSVARQRKFQP